MVRVSVEDKPTMGLEWAVGVGKAAVPRYPAWQVKAELSPADEGEGPRCVLHVIQVILVWYVHSTI